MKWSGTSAAECFLGHIGNWRPLFLVLAALKGIVQSGNKDNVREIVKQLILRLKGATDWLVSILMQGSTAVDSQLLESAICSPWNVPQVGPKVSQMICLRHGSLNSATGFVSMEVACI